MAELVTRFGDDVRRRVTYALGGDPDFEDVVQDVFEKLIECIHQIRDPDCMASWVQSVAVYCARNHLRRRRRWRWISYKDPEDIPEPEGPPFDPERAAMAQALFRVVRRMPEAEGRAFWLRFVWKMELTEVAEACSVSLATIKRRLRRAETRFLNSAEQEDALAESTELDEVRRQSTGLKATTRIRAKR